MHFPLHLPPASSQCRGSREEEVSHRQREGASRGRVPRDGSELGRDPLSYSKKKLFIIYGKWTECLWGIEPASYESFKKQEKRGDHPRKAKLVSRPAAALAGSLGG